MDDGIAWLNSCVCCNESGEKEIQPQHLDKRHHLEYMMSRIR